MGWHDFFAKRKIHKGFVKVFCNGDPCRNNNREVGKTMFHFK